MATVFVERLTNSPQTRTGEQQCGHVLKVEHELPAAIERVGGQRSRSITERWAEHVVAGSDAGQAVIAHNVVIGCRATDESFGEIG